MVQGSLSRGRRCQQSRLDAEPEPGTSEVNTVESVVYLPSVSPSPSSAASYVGLFSKEDTLVAIGSVSPSQQSSLMEDVVGATRLPLADTPSSPISLSMEAQEFGGDVLVVARICPSTCSLRDCLRTISLKEVVWLDCCYCPLSTRRSYNPYE